MIILNEINVRLRQEEKPIIATIIIFRNFYRINHSLFVTSMKSTSNIS